MRERAPRPRIVELLAATRGLSPDPFFPSSRFRGTRSLSFHPLPPLRPSSGLSESRRADPRRRRRRATAGAAQRWNLDTAVRERIAGGEGVGQKALNYVFNRALHLSDTSVAEYPRLARCRPDVVVVVVRRARSQEMTGNGVKRSVTSTWVALSAILDNFVEYEICRKK